MSCQFLFRCLCLEKHVVYGLVFVLIVVCIGQLEFAESQQLNATPVTEINRLYVYCYTMLNMYYVSLSFFNLVWQRLISLRCCWFVLLQYIQICSDFISRVTKGIIMETLMNINTTSTLYETELLLIRLPSYYPFFSINILKTIKKKNIDRDPVYLHMFIASV